MVFLESAAVQWKKMERKRRSRRRKSDRKSKLQGNRRAGIIRGGKRGRNGAELRKGWPWMGGPLKEDLCELRGDSRRRKC